MDDSQEQISELTSKVERLEVCLEKLNQEHKKTIQALILCDEVLHNHRKAMSAELADAFDRIIGLELKAYPHLVEDIGHLHAVIGDRETKAYNPLDFRDPTKRRT